MKKNLHEDDYVYRHKDYYVYRYNKCRVYRREKKTYMKVIVSIDIKIIMSIYIITASLSATRLRCWAAKGAGCPLDIGFRRFVGASFSPKSV